MRNRTFIGRKRLLNILIAWVIACAILSAHASPGDSVVRIKASKSDGATVGSGFVWSDSGYVVTALHVVAGAKKITVYSESKKKSTAASIYAVLHEPDLALLKLDRDIGLVPLDISPADPNSTEVHFIWGFPHDVAEMTRHRVEMVGGLNQAPTLASLFKNRKQLERTIGLQGYPKLEARIFRITKIQPGHSGAPIIDRSGRVIGIGDGGLRDGLGGLNWAIPASLYLPKLKNSADPVPGESSAQSSLFNVPIDAAPVIFEETKDHVLRRVWRASLGEILDAMQDDDLDDIYEYLDASARDDLGMSLDSAVIEVFEDQETGATFAIPEDMNFRYDINDKMMLVGSGSGPEMFIQAIIDDSWEASSQHLQRFTDKLNNLGVDWQKDPDWRDEKEVNGKEKYAYYNLFRQVPDTFNEDAPPLAELDTVLIIDDKAFLGTAVVALNVESFTDKDWYNHYLMMICTQMADFAGY